jgi:hypothetical protein
MQADLEHGCNTLCTLSSLSAPVGQGGLHADQPLSEVRHDALAVLGGRR